MLPTAIAAWDHQQWGVFIATLAAGLLAALFAGPVARARADVRVDRHRNPTIAALWPHTVRADIAEHLAEGPGSLTTLGKVGPGSITVAEPLVDPDIAAELADVLGGALETFRIAVEPSMRKARLWALQGGETYAAGALRSWHLMMCEQGTAEYPIVVSSGARA